MIFESSIRLLLMLLKFEFRLGDDNDDEWEEEELEDELLLRRLLL
jgi:hypothetical protein